VLLQVTNYISIALEKCKKRMRHYLNYSGTRILLSSAPCGSLSPTFSSGRVGRVETRARVKIALFEECARTRGGRVTFFAAGYVHAHVFLKGHSQLMHMRIRDHFLADLHVTRRA